MINVNMGVVPLVVVVVVTSVVPHRMEYAVVIPVAHQAPSVVSETAVVAPVGEEEEDTLFNVARA